jgi:hypothetical protein
MHILIELYGNERFVIAYLPTLKTNLSVVLVELAISQSSRGLGLVDVWRDIWRDNKLL